MAWTASIISKDGSDGRVQLGVQVTDGVNTYKTSFLVDFRQATLAWLKDQIRSWVAAIDDAKALAAQVTIGPLDITAGTPTPAEAAYAAYKQDIETENIVAQAIKHGILTGTETWVVSLRNRLKTDVVLPDYLPLLRMLQ